MTGREGLAVMNRIEAGRPVPSRPVALLPVAQLHTRDVPALRPPGDADLLQVLWCPFDHPDQDMPRTELFWRSSAAVRSYLSAPPEPEVVQHEGYVPRPCALHPEPVTEYPAPMELDDDLRADIEEWSARQKAGADPGSAYDGAEDAFYDYELSVAPGWKVGGWPPWGFTDPVQLSCRRCGTEMEPLLTIASAEWDLGTASWVPYEEQGEASYPSPESPTMIVIGDGYSQQIYACPMNPEHPHTELMQ